MSTAPAGWRPDLHVRLSRRYTRELRATRASAAAFAVSLAAWVVGLAPGNHALAVVIAAAVAAALPARPLVGRAFGWIGREAGLAYQTFVEHADRPDPHGLLAAAEVHARLSIRGVAAPPRDTWWLPLAAAALGVWLVASFVGGLVSLPGGGGAGAPGASPTTPTPPPVVAPDEPEPEDPEAEPPPETAEADQPTGPQDPAAPGDHPDAAAGEGVGQDALDRFLDNLRERPTQEPEPSASELERMTREARDAGAPDDPQVERRDEQGDAPSTLRPGDQEAEQDEEGDAAAGAGDEAGEEPPEVPSDGGNAEAEGDDETGEPGDEAGQEPGDEGDPGDGPDGAPDAPGADEEIAFDAGDGDDAGIGAGRPDESEGAAVEPMGPEESLRGMLLPGEETPGGRVRLPGQEGGVLPEGASVERYERAVEQAITDGTVPVPYQEIIRNYFR